jgi:hypothetical protein
VNVFLWVVLEITRKTISAEASRYEDEDRAGKCPHGHPEL